LLKRHFFQIIASLLQFMFHKSVAML